MENADFVDTLWGVITKLDYFLGFIFMHLQVFLSSMYRTGIFFVGCLFVVVVVCFFCLFVFFFGGGGWG